MRHAKGAMLEDTGTQKSCQWVGSQVGVGWIRRARVWERLKGFVGAKAISNIQNKSFGRSFVLLDSIRLHAMDDRTDEVDVEDGINVHEVEDHSKGQESTSS